MTAHGITLAVVCMFALIAMTKVRLHSPYCPFCGKTREHAKDCPTQRGR